MPRPAPRLAPVTNVIAPFRFGGEWRCAVMIVNIASKRLRRWRVIEGSRVFGLGSRVRADALCSECRRQAGDAQLLKHSQLVEVVPAFDEPSVLDPRKHHPAELHAP